MQQSAALAMCAGAWLPSPAAHLGRAVSGGVGRPCLHPAGERPSLQVSDCGWVARRAPSLRSLYSLCRNMHAWLRRDPGNVCVVHCMVSGPASPGTQDREDL